MKLTKQALKRIIKEELARLVEARPTFELKVRDEVRHKSEDLGVGTIIQLAPIRPDRVRDAKVEWPSGVRRIYDAADLVPLDAEWSSIDDHDPRDIGDGETKEDEKHVYVLWDILDQYDQNIFGIYSSPERAEAAKKVGKSEGMTTEFRIEPIRLDLPPE